MLLPTLVRYPIDTTGIHPDNRITNERHEVTPTQRTIVPKQRYFYGESLVVALNGVELKLGTQYQVDDLIPDLTKRTSKAVMSSIIITDDTVLGEVTLDYQCYGSDDQFTRTLLADLVSQANARRDIYYQNILGLPEVFPPEPHRHPITDTYGWNATIHLFTEMVNILSNWRFTRDGAMYGKISELQDLINERIAQFQVELANARVANNIIAGLDNKVDEAIARLQQEVSALSSVQDMQNLMNRVKNEITEAYKAADVVLGDTITTGYKKADKGLSDRIDALTTRVDGLSTSDELNNRFNQYLPLATYNQDKPAFAKVTDVDTLNQAMVLRPTLTTVTSAIAEAVRSIPWDNLSGKPRIWTDTYRNNTSKDFNTYITIGTYYLENMSTNFPNSLSRDRSGILRVYESEMDVWQFFTEKNGTTWLRTGTINGRLISRWSDWESNGFSATPLPKNDGAYTTDILGVLSDKTCGFYTAVGPMTAINLPVSMLGSNGIPRSDARPDWAILNMSASGQRTVFASAGYRNHYIVTDEVDTHGFRPERLMTDMVLSQDYPRIWNVGTELDELRGLVNAAANNTEHINRLRQEVQESYVPLNRVQTQKYDHAVDKLPKYDNEGTISATKFVVGTATSSAKTFSYDAGSSAVVLNGLFKPVNIQLTSDIRLKTDIKPIVNPIDIVTNITGYHYAFKADSRKAVGVIAQDVEKVLPDAVSTDDEGTRSVDYNAIVAVLVETVKTQQQLIERLDSRISELEALLKR